MSDVRRSVPFLALLLFLAALGLGSAHAEWKEGEIVAAEATDGSGRKFQKGRVLVFPRAGLELKDIDETLKGMKAKRVKRIRNSNVHVVEVADGDEERVVTALRRDRRFKNAELNVIRYPTAVPNDPRYSSLWHLQKIEAPGAWEHATGAGVTIAIVDTGVNAAHEDLAERMVPGWNIISNNANTNDIHGHGTSVAGLAASAGNNGIGGTGVNWNANIMPLQVASVNSGQASSNDFLLAEAVRWAVDHGAKVINLSWSGVPNSATIHDAGNYARRSGAVVVVAADNTSGFKDWAPSDSVVVIGATTTSDTRAGFSTYGPHVDLGAPGLNVSTTARGGGYGDFSGTSAASPVGAGVYGLMMSANPALLPSQLDQIAFETAQDLGTPGRDNEFGHGRINAAAAVARALVTPPLNDQEPPVASITAPAAGGQWSGVLNVDATATDNRAVMYVDLYLNGTKIITDTSPPYAFSVNTRFYNNGSASFEVRAGDESGNVGVSQPVNGTIFNDLAPPTLQFTSPAAGSTVSGTITVRLNAADNIGVTQVNLYRGETLLGTQTAAPYRFNWDTRKGFNGAVQLRARAADAANNAAQATLSLTVNNVDTQVPTTSITTPVGGSTVTGRQQLVEVKAGDNGGVERVELYFQGALVGTTRAAPYRFYWDTTKHPNGRGHLTSKAYDYLGNSKVSSKRAVIVAN